MPVVHGLVAGQCGYMMGGHLMGLLATSAAKARQWLACPSSPDMLFSLPLLPSTWPETAKQGPDSDGFLRLNKVFQDHFGSVAADYAQSRPGYPRALFDWLASLCARHDLAWDCGTGNGQAAAALAGHFRQVLATDASAAQIAQAIPHSHVAYRVASAERCGLTDDSADLVVVAQALHWFDLDRFYAEARRVLKPEGVIAAWSYGVLKVDDAAVDTQVQAFYRDQVGAYWPPERHHVETGYRDLAFPFAPIEAPAFSMQVEWTLAQLLGYFRSWSATARFIQDQGYDPVGELEQSLEGFWGNPERQCGLVWPLFLRVGYASG
jgi:SAM-dependent methyltransferase